MLRGGGSVGCLVCISKFEFSFWFSGFLGCVMSVLGMWGVCIGSFLIGGLCFLSEGFG